MRKTLEERFWAKVERSEGCWLWTASVQPSGYGQINGGGRGKGMLLAHRVSYEFANGPIPPGMQVDIMCHTRRCVNPGHMRLVTNKQNSENRCGAAKHSGSGVRGVKWDSARGLWLAYAVHNGRMKFAGRFAEMHDAEAAAIAKRLELFTHNERDKDGLETNETCVHTHARDMKKPAP